MTFLRKIFNFYIDASLHVALAVYALVRVTMLNFNIEYDENISYVIFYGAIVGYNFLKYAGTAEKYIFVDKTYTKIIQGLSFLAFFLSIYYIFHLPFKILYRIGGLVVVTVLYLIPLSTTKRNIRSLAGIKVFIVALVWTASTVLLPVINANNKVDFNVFIEAIQRFVYVIIIMIPFEIRDLKEDSIQLKTIPQQLGIKNTKIFGLVFLIPFYLMEFLKDVVDSENLIVMAILSIITGVLIVFSEENQGKYYSGFWVESLPILWWVLLLLMKSL